MTLNGVEAVNSGNSPKKPQNLRANNNLIKASIFDYKTEDLNQSGTAFLNNRAGGEIELAFFKQTLDWAHTPNNLLKQTNFNEQINNIGKSNDNSFFSGLKDFIMNFGDIKPEEFSF